MSNYNQQQQAVILKGVAQQILSMNVPSFNQAEKLFNEFGIDFEGNQVYSQMYAALEVALSLGEDSKEFIKKNFNLKWNSDVVHRIAHYAMKMDKPDETQLRLKVLTGK
jgi:predicted Zn-dependent protease